MPIFKSMNYTDKEIIKGLIENNEKMIRHFFFEKCAPMLGYIVSKLFAHRGEKDELACIIHKAIKKSS